MSEEQQQSLPDVNGEKTGANGSRTDKDPRNGQFAKGNKLGNRWKKGESGLKYGRTIETHREFRDLIRKIGAEVIDPHKGLTRAELMVRDMMGTGNATDRTNIIEHGWGKVPDELRIKTWRDEVLELMKQGVLTPMQVRAELPEPDANELIMQAGLAVLRDASAAAQVVEGVVVEEGAG